MYFFTINYTVVFFFVMHIELLGVRNVLCKKNFIWNNIWNTTKVIFCLFLLLFRILLWHFTAHSKTSESLQSGTVVCVDHTCGLF